MTIKRVLGLFKDFDQASAALRELREANLPQLNWDDVTIKSPMLFRAENVKSGYLDSSKTNSVVDAQGRIHRGRQNLGRSRAARNNANLEGGIPWNAPLRYWSRIAFPRCGASCCVCSRLSGDDWSRPTAAPQWSVKDVAAHLLGGDVWILSSKRDGFRSSGAEIQDHRQLIELVNRSNREWVLAARRISTRLLMDFLRLLDLRSKRALPLLIRWRWAAC